MSNRMLLVSAVVLLGTFSLPAFSADTAAGDPVVARVNGDEIHRSDVMRELQMMGPQVQQLPPQMIYPQILQRIIATKLVSAKGYADKLQNTPELKHQLKDIEAQLVAEAYVHHEIQPKISETKVKDFYDSEIVAKFKPQDEVRARHILVKTEDEANDVLKQLKGGADFAKLAEEKSIDKGSGKQGGDLGYFTHDSMVKPFSDAAYAMKPGDVSEKPVKTEFGYHIIKVEDKRKSAPPALAEVRPQIEGRLGQEMTNTLIKDLEAKAKIERFNLDGTPVKSADAGKTDDAGATKK